MEKLFFISRFIVVVAFVVSVFFWVSKQTTGKEYEPNVCPEVSVDFAITLYSKPAPFYSAEGELVEKQIRHDGSQLLISCFPGFDLPRKSMFVCKDGTWVAEDGEQELPTACRPGYTFMQKFVIFTFVFVTLLATFTSAKAVYDECTGQNRLRSGARSTLFGIGNIQYKPLTRYSASASIAEMGNNAGFCMIIETIALFAGFSPHFFVFLDTGIWYLNPAQETMKNPGQAEISMHVVFGFTICCVMGIMAALIKYGKYGGLAREVHKVLGTYVIPPVCVAFLLSAVWAELQLPGSIPQKIARNMLVIWCVVVLYNVVTSAFVRDIAAHLHYLVALWGLICSAGALRGMTIVWGYLLGCEYGYGANPCLGIVTGTAFSTLLPMALFIYLNGTWNKRYARKAFLFAAYYQLLIPLYVKYLFKPCYPRMNLHNIYHDYAFALPREFYSSEEQYHEHFMQALGH